MTRETLLALLCAAVGSVSADVVIENRTMRIVLGDDALVRSLVAKATGEELVACPAPCAWIVEERPYDNEYKLIYPAKPRRFEAVSAAREGDRLVLGFRDHLDILTLRLDIGEDYVGIETEKRAFCDDDSVNDKQPMPFDALTFFSLALKRRAHWGEWMNGVWDDRAGVTLMSVLPETFADSRCRDDGAVELSVATTRKSGTLKGRAVLVAAAGAGLLPAIAHAERAYGLPNGAEMRMKPDLRAYLRVGGGLCRTNVDDYVRWAKKGGFRTMLLCCENFSDAFGHLPWNERYPNGASDLRCVTDAIRAAGIEVGLHCRPSKVSTNDVFVSGGVPDSRLAVTAEFRLAAGVSAEDSAFSLEGESTELEFLDWTKFDWNRPGRKLLRIDDELVTYASHGDFPFSVGGLTRGVLGTEAKRHARGAPVWLLAVDDSPRVIRVDQRFGLQDELSGRLAEIWKAGGFTFLYLDGAEDVNPPYWLNVARAQKSVYDRLEPKPLFVETAFKAHWCWHFLTRGNAFDVFRPERTQSAVDRYVIRGARLAAEDFSTVNFGWFGFRAPTTPGDEPPFCEPWMWQTMGTQPDMMEYVVSKACAWNAPFSMNASLRSFAAHPRADDIFDIIRRWEDLKLSGGLPDPEKARVREQGRAFMLLETAKGRELVEYRLVTPAERRGLRAFSFVREGKSGVVFWHTQGEGSLTLEAGGLQLADMGLRPLPLDVDSRGRAVVPVSSRRILLSDEPESELVRRFRAGVFADSPSNDIPL